MSPTMNVLKHSCSLTDLTWRLMEFRDFSSWTVFHNHWKNSKSESPTAKIKCSDLTAHWLTQTLYILSLSSIVPKIYRWLYIKAFQYLFEIRLNKCGLEDTSMTLRQGLRVVQYLSCTRHRKIPPSTSNIIKFFEATKTSKLKNMSSLVL